MTDPRSGGPQPETPLDQYPFDALLAEYKDLAAEVRRGLHYSDGLFQGGALVALLGVAALDLEKMYWSLLVAPAVLAVIAGFAMRNIAEYHAQGGYKRALEQTLNRLLVRRSPWVWESVVVPSTRSGVISFTPYLYAFAGLLLATGSLLASWQLEFGGQNWEWGVPVLTACLLAALSVFLYLGFHNSRAISEMSCESAFAALACLDCGKEPPCPEPARARYTARSSRSFRETSGWICRLPECWERATKADTASPGATTATA